MSPQVLVAIYDELWRLQTAAGVQLKRKRKDMLDSEIYAWLDTLFEKHRVQAYETVMQSRLQRQNDAQLLMVKSYLTYFASEKLEGYANGGADWVKELDERIKSHIERRRTAIEGV